MKLIDLGWCIARLNDNKNFLTIVSPAEGQENFFVPAASVNIIGESEIKKLRDALNEEYPE